VFAFVSGKLQSWEIWCDLASLPENSSGVFRFSLIRLFSVEVVQKIVFLGEFGVDVWFIVLGVCFCNGYGYLLFTVDHARILRKNDFFFFFFFVVCDEESALFSQPCT